jgi:starch-binding outer membrane protein, SusD/RagB family
MKNLIRNNTVKSLVILFLALVSCNEDFLDLKPLDQEVTSTFYKTQDHAQQALVAVYDVLTYQSTPGVSWAPFITVSDLLSDDAFAGGSDANDGFNQQQMNTFNTPATNPIAHSIWIKNYIGIYRANLYLEIIDQVNAPESFKDRTIAEAKFLRAYFNFEQVRFFENIPLLTATIKGPSEYKQYQNTPQEVYDQIAVDLVESIDHLPESVPQVEAGRITKWAAKALLARVYLFYNGVYNADMNAGDVAVNRTYVLDHLEDLIANSGLDLFDDYSHNFRLVGEFGVESVFEISYGDTPEWWDWGYVRGGNGNLSAQMQGPRVGGSSNWNRGWSFAPVSHKLAEFLREDPRFVYTILTEEELDGTLVKGFQHTGYFSKKYSSDAEHWGAGGQFELNRTCNHRVIRFSDVLLMAAELDSPAKQQYLDRVRARVGLPSVPATMENIFRERRLELSLEGIRYYDVIRRGLAYAGQELTHSGIRGPRYEGDQQIFDVTFSPATKGFLPIPQTEIDLSEGAFVQNAGY